MNTDSEVRIPNAVEASSSSSSSSSTAVEPRNPSVGEGRSASRGKSSLELPIALSDSSLSSYSSWLLSCAFVDEGGESMAPVVRSCNCRRRRRRRAEGSCWPWVSRAAVSSPVDESDEEEGWEAISIQESVKGRNEYIMCR